MYLMSLTTIFYFIIFAQKQFHVTSDGIREVHIENVISFVILHGK